MSFDAMKLTSDFTKKNHGFWFSSAWVHTNVEWGIMYPQGDLDTALTHLSSKDLLGNYGLQVEPKKTDRGDAIMVRYVGPDILTTYPAGYEPGGSESDKMLHYIRTCPGITAKVIVEARAMDLGTVMKHMKFLLDYEMIQTLRDWKLTNKGPITDTTPLYARDVTIDSMSCKVRVSQFYANMKTTPFYQAFDPNDDPIRQGLDAVVDCAKSAVARVKEVNASLSEKPEESVEADPTTTDLTLDKARHLLNFHRAKVNSLESFIQNEKDLQESMRKRTSLVAHINAEYQTKQDKETP